MNKQKIAFLSAVAALATTTLMSGPVFAQTTSATAKTAAKSSIAGSSGGGNAMMMVPGVIISSVIGTPICFARKWKQEMDEYTHGFIGSIVKDENNKVLMAPAAIIALPGATITAFLESPVLAFRNAYMAEKPFSKEQFSLGDME